VQRSPATRFTGLFGCIGRITKHATLPPRVHLVEQGHQIAYRIVPPRNWVPIPKHSYPFRVILGSFCVGKGSISVGTARGVQCKWIDRVADACNSGIAAHRISAAVTAGGTHEVSFC
jgi:hypothetical protein